MQFLDKIGNIIGRLICFLTALIFALVPFLFIKELLSAPCWSPSPKTRRNGTSTPKTLCCTVPKGMTVSSNLTRKSTGQDWKR